MMETRGQTQQLGAQLLRQLGLGLSSYRLYPGAVERLGFVSVTQRIGQTAQAALAVGAVEAEVRSGRMHVAGAAVEDDRADVLADACFQRRVERLRITAPPTVRDLDALFDALIRDPEEVHAAGGVAALLAARSVESLLASERAPDPTTGEIDPDHEQLGTAADDPGGLSDPEAGLPELAPRPGETAVQLYERLRTVSDGLGENASARSGFFVRAAELAAALDETEQLAFTGLVLDLAGREAFAERFVGHLTDTALASAVTGLAAARGRDAVELAAEVAAVTRRHGTLVRLVEMAGAGAPATASPLPDPGGEPAGAADSRASADVPESQRLRDAFPSDPADHMQLAATALRDYLWAGPDLQQAERTMAAASAQLRADLRSLAPQRISALLTALDAASARTPSEIQPLLHLPRRQALNADVLTDIAAAAAGDGAAAVEVLRPFGQRAVDALIEALAAETRRAVRASLLSLLVAVAASDLRQLEPHLADPRWFVARNIASALRRLGGAPTVPLLERLAAHPHEAVRHEARLALESAPPERAAPALARLAAAQHDRSERQACLRALAGLRGPEAGRLLAQLGDRRAGWGLPWRLRRHARALARRELRA